MFAARASNAIDCTGVWLAALAASGSSDERGLDAR